MSEGSELFCQHMSGIVLGKLDGANQLADDDGKSTSAFMSAAAFT
jgi:hypothetical protein